MRLRLQLCAWQLAALSCAAQPPRAASPAAAGSAATEPVSAPAAARLEPEGGAGCRAGLAALAAGRLDEWHGLAGCTRADAEAALGSSGDQPARFERFGEYLSYRSATNSVTAWFLDRRIRVVEVLYPKLTRPLTEALGEPEARAPSRLSQEWEQWIYAGRGLTAHVSRADGEVVTLFGYAPMTVEEFEQTDIARVSKGDPPIEELR